MEKITSPSSEQVKKLITLQEKGKARKEEGVFIAEGIKMVLETPPEKAVKIYVSESAQENYKAASGHKELCGGQYTLLSDAVFKKVSGTVTPQGVLAIVKQDKKDEAELIKEISKCSKPNKTKILVLDDIRDPGNMGTIIRTAEAAGIAAIFISPNSVDIYNPKVVRSTMGSIYRVPLCISSDLAGTIANLKKAGFVLYAAHLNGAEIGSGISYPAKYGFIIGNEARGISPEISALADELIKIPMHGKVESLNAAIAAAVLMYS